MDWVQALGAEEPTIEAYGAVFEVFPPEGFTYGGFGFEKSARPRVMDTGYATAGTSTTITLAASVDEEDDFYNGQQITILEGPGVGETKQVIDFAGSTRLVTIEGSWSEIPTTASHYEISRPEKLFIEDFFPYEVRRRGGRYYLVHLLRLPAGIKAVDPGRKSEGGSV